MLKVFGVQHIIYLVVSMLITACVIVLAKKFLKTDEQKAKFIKILGLIYLVLILSNRSFCYYYFVVIAKKDDTFLPFTFCGTVSFFFSICLLFTKKDSNAYHFFVYVALLAGLIPTIYPNYIADGTVEPFFNNTIFFPPTFTSLLCHSMMFMMALIIPILGQMKPSIKKWACFPIGYALLTQYGVVYDYIFNANKGFNIKGAILGPFYSSNIFIYGVALHTLIVVIFDIVENKENSLFPRLYRSLFKKQH